MAIWRKQTREGRGAKPHSEGGISRGTAARKAKEERPIRLVWPSISTTSLTNKVGRGSARSEHAKGGVVIRKYGDIEDGARGPFRPSMAWHRRDLAENPTEDQESRIVRTAQPSRVETCNRPAPGTNGSSAVHVLCWNRSVRGSQLWGISGGNPARKVKVERSMHLGWSSLSPSSLP